MAILSLLAKLGLDKTGFDTGIHAAEHQIKHFGEHIKGHLAAAFGAGALIALTERVLEAGKEFTNLSQRMGVSVETAQQFALAAKLGGADAEYMATKFDKLKKAMSIAISGGSNPFEKFGFSVERLKELRPEDIWREMAIEMQYSTMTADQSVAALEIYGRGAGKVANILKNFPAAGKGTIFFSKEDIEELEHAEQLITKVYNNIKIGFGKLLTEINKRNATLIFPMAPLVNAIIGRKKGHGEEAPDNEEQIIHDQEEANKAAHAHMAIMDRVLQMDKDAIKLERDAAEAGMPENARKNKLMHERLTLMENLRTMVGELDAAEEEARAAMRKRLGEVNLDLARLDKPKPAVEFKGEKLPTGGLGSIGGTIPGGGALSAVSVARDQLRMLKELKDIMDRRGMVVKAWR